MSSIRQSALIFAFLPVLAACSAPSTPLGEAVSPIIDGTTDIGDPGVVLLASYPKNQSVLDTCTAIVIAPTVLLTAAHCVDSTNHPNYTYGVFTGFDSSPYPTLVDLIPELEPATAVYANPNYDPASPFHADIGVVLLANPIGVTPLPVNRDPLDASIVGNPARIIGYGQTVVGTLNAAKHEASTAVVSLGADDTIVVGDAQRHSCLGDSGGPALVVLAGIETVVGVDSYGDSNCDAPANYRRTDVYADFIDMYAPSPSPVDAGMGGSTSATGSGGAAGSGGSSVVSAASSSVVSSSTTSRSTTSSSTTSSGAGGSGGVAETATTSGDDSTPSAGSPAPQASSGCAIATSDRPSGVIIACSFLSLAAALRRRRSC